jgi:small subunit ribosomal protein S6
MNKYELTVLLDGKTTAAKVKTVTEKITKIAKLFEGKVAKVNDWGKKDLTYKIKKNTTLYYLNFELELTGAAAHKLNDKLRVDEELIRHLLIRI